MTCSFKDKGYLSTTKSIFLSIIYMGEKEISMKKYLYGIRFQRSTLISKTVYQHNALPTPRKPPFWKLFW